MAGFPEIPNRQEASQDLEKSQPDYEQTIMALLRANSRFDFGSYKAGTLIRRIQRRMGLHHVQDPAQYVRLLRESPDEVTALFKDLLVGVTNFFRDPKAWEKLAQDAIGPLVQRKRNAGLIRVWVPGCATGEEAYSIAMLLTERLRATQASCGLQIFASDIDAESLSIARAGVYPENIVADVPSPRLQQFFTTGEQTTANLSR